MVSLKNVFRPTLWDLQRTALYQEERSTWRATREDRYVAPQLPEGLRGRLGEGGNLTWASSPLM